MADFKATPVTLFKNEKATPENKQPVLNGYLEITEPLAPGKYKFGCWKNKNGKDIWNSGKLEPAGNNGNQRRSNEQYKSSPGDLPF